MNDYRPFPAPEQPDRDLRQDRLQLSAVLIAGVSITLIGSAAQILLLLIVRTFFPSLITHDWFGILASCLPLYLVAMPLSLLIFNLAKPMPPKAGARIGFPAWLGLLAICFALMYVGNFIGIIVNAIIGIVKGSPPENTLDQMTANTPFWANLLVLGILAPILEELFYRKLVIDRLRRFGDLPAVLISGLLFGLIHGNFSQFFYATLIGVFFGLIYLRTGKLRYSISLHMSVNLLGGVMTSELLKHLSTDVPAADPLAYISENMLPLLILLAYFGFILLCFIATPIACFLLRKQFRFERAEKPLAFTQWRRVLLCNPVVWISLILLILPYFFV